MKEILIICLCVFLFLAIVMAILFHHRIRDVKRRLREAAEAREARRMAEEDEYFKRTSTKHYHEEEKPKFKDDYFKSADRRWRHHH